MKKLKLQILTEYKTPMPLMQADGIKVLIPYENGETLEKNSVDVIDASRGLIEVALSDFEIQGLPVSEGLTFNAKVTMLGHDYIVTFAKGLKIGMKDERKIIL